MHVIIEGFDGTGKSTLCQLLSMATGWPAVHQSPRPPKSIAGFRTVGARAMETTCRPDLISDRWPWISDHCYDLHEKGPSTEETVMSLRQAKVDRIIHCDVDHVEDLRIEARPGDAQDAEQTALVQDRALQILAVYRRLMGELRARGFNVRRCVMIGGRNG